MRGARRCGVPVNWRKRWARCSRSAIAGMCLMRRRGCIICGVGTIIRGGGGLLMRMLFYFKKKQAESIIYLLIATMHRLTMQTLRG